MFFIFCRRRSKTQYGKLCEKQISVVRSGFLGEKMELYVLKCAIIVVFRGSAANPRWDIVALYKIIKLNLFVIWLLPGQRDPARNGSHCGVVLLGSGKRAPVWNVVKHDLTLFALGSLPRLVQLDSILWLWTNGANAMGNYWHHKQSSWRQWRRWWLHSRLRRW